MADLYHLLDEPVEVAQSIEEEEAGSWNGDDDDAIVPVALQEAARHPYASSESPSKGIRSDIVEKLKRLDDPWSSSGAQSLQQLHAELQELPYTRLYQAWWHECHAPDLLPYPEAVLPPIRAGLARYQAYMDDCADDDQDDDANENVTALIHSVLRIDAERVKFLVSDLLRRRIQKITSQHPQYYADQTALLSSAERSLLQEYQVAVARHLATTVTDHFPQAVWRSLDVPTEFRDADQASFCFVRCLEDVVIGEALQPAGVCRVVRYARIRSLLLEGKVELL